MVPPMAQESLRGDAGSTRQGPRRDSPSEAWTILSHLFTGIGVFALIGWGVDRLLGTHWLVLIGLLLGGVAAGALIYIRYLYVPPTPPTPPIPQPPGGPAGPVDRKEQHG